MGVGSVEIAIQFCRVLCHRYTADNNFLDTRFDNLIILGSISDRNA